LSAFFLSSDIFFLTGPTTSLSIASFVSFITFSCAFPPLVMSFALFIRTFPAFPLSPKNCPAAPFKFPFTILFPISFSSFFPFLICSAVMSDVISLSGSNWAYSKELGSILSFLPFSLFSISPATVAFSCPSLLGLAFPLSNLSLIPHSRPIPALTVFSSAFSLMYIFPVTLS